MTRLEMMDKVVKMIGFENEKVIGFFRLCESLEDNETNNRYLKALCEVIIASENF